MKIIKMPSHKCEKCGCEYEYNKDDFAKKHEYIGETQPNGFSSPKSVYIDSIFVECPLCGAIHIIKSERKEQR